MARSANSLPGCLLWPLALAAAVLSCAGAKPEPKYPCDRELIELQADRASERRTVIQSGACKGMYTTAECPALKALYERWSKVLDAWERCEQ